MYRLTRSFAVVVLLALMIALLSMAWRAVQRHAGQQARTVVLQAYTNAAQPLADIEKAFGRALAEQAHAAPTPAAIAKWRAAIAKTVSPLLSQEKLLLNQIDIELQNPGVIVLETPQLDATQALGVLSAVHNVQRALTAQLSTKLQTLDPLNSAQWSFFEPLLFVFAIALLSWLWYMATKQHRVAERVGRVFEHIRNTYDLSVRVPVMSPGNDMSVLASNFNRLMDSLERDVSQGRQQAEAKLWIAAGLAQLERSSAAKLGRTSTVMAMLSEIHQYTSAQHAQLYRRNVATLKLELVHSPQLRTWLADGDQYPGYTELLEAGAMAEQPLSIKLEKLPAAASDPADRTFARVAVAVCVSENNAFFGVVVVVFFSQPHEKVVAYLNRAAKIISLAISSASARALQQQLNHDLHEQQSQERRRFELLVGSMVDGMVVTDTSGRIAYANPALTKWLGYDIDSLRKKPYAALFAASETNPHLISQAPLAEREDSVLQTLVVDRSGRFHPAEVSIRRVESIDGAVLGITLHDIASRIEREQRIAYDAAFQAALIDAIPNPIMVKDSNGIVVRINRAHEHMFGHERSELIGKPSWSPAIHQNFTHHLTLTPTQIVALDQQVFATGQPVSLPVKIASTNDGVRDCIYLKVPLNLPNRGRVGVVTQFIDVTTLREAERRGLSANELLEGVARDLPLGVFQLREIAAGATVFSYTNPKFAALLRSDREQLTQQGKQTLLSLLEPDDARMLDAAIGESQDSIDINVRFDFGDRKGWLNISMSRSGTPRAVGMPQEKLWTGYANDITAIRLAEEERAQQTDFLQKLIDALPVGVAVKDNHRRFLTVNAEAQKLFGMPRNKMVGRTTLELKKEGARLQIPDAIKYAKVEDEVIDGGERREAEVITTDELGNTLNIITLRLPIVLPLSTANKDDQSRKGLMIISQDVTTFRAQEASIRQSNELLQRIASNVPGAIFEITIDGDLDESSAWHFSYISDGLEPMMGVLLDEVYRDSAAFSQNVVPEDRAALEAFWQALCTHAPARSEIEFRYRVGSTVRHALAVATRTLDAGIAEKRTYTGYLSDITERKRAMQDQAFQAALLNSLLEALPLPVYAKARDLRYSMANRAYCELIGVAPAQLLRRLHHEVESSLVISSGPTPQANLQYQARLLTDASSFEFERGVVDASASQRDTRWLYRPFSVSGVPEGLICVVVDMTEARAALRIAEGAQQVAETARRQLFQTTANVPVVIFEGQNVRAQLGTDTDTVYRWNFISPSLIDLLGVTHIDALADAGSAFAQVNAHDQARLNDFFLALESDTQANAEIDFKATLDGLERTLKMVTRLLERDPAALGLSWVGFIVDVTVERQRADDLRQAMAAAEEAAAVKAIFLANMSHEIRTPLNAVIGMTHLALRTQLSQKQLDYLTKIRNAGTTLQALINDILDFSKIEAGKMSIEAAPFDLSRSLANIAANNSLKAEDKALRLEFEIEPSLPLVVVGDAARLEQVLNNLCSNALKFTEQGKVVVSVRLIAQQAHQLTLLFCVQDSGIGISQEQQNRLFQSFVQADGSTTRKYGGTGLGLSISRKLVELMGGEIWIESAAGTGSKFFWTAVLRRASIADFRRLVGAQPRHAVDVVAPNLAERSQVRRRLTSLRVRTRWWSSFDDFLAFLAKHPNAVRPWLFVSQAALDLDVSSVQEQLARWMLLAPQTQLVVLSQVHTDQRSEQLYSLGAASVLVWPYGLAAVSDVLMRDATKARSVSGGYKEHAQMLSGVRVLLAEDNLINQQIAVEMLNAVGCTVTVASNGQQVLDILLSYNGTQLPFDIVLMDFQMPIMDGWATVARMRATPAWASLPILALTAHALPEEVARTRQAGMIDHITKPIDTANLYAAVAKALNRHDAIVSAVAPLGALERQLSGFEKHSGTSPVDFVAGLRRVSGHQALYLRLLRQFAESYVDAADQMLSLIDGGDFQQCLLRLHNLRGVSGNISATDVHDMAARAELIVRRCEQNCALRSVAQEAISTLGTALAAACNAIELYRGERQLNLQSTQKLPTAAKRTLTDGLQQLFKLLQQQDADAQDALLIIEADLREILPPERWHTLYKAIDLWQFDLALTLLADIKLAPPFAP